ncbi:MAG: FadR/GntR family transcriptional regulator [Desulfonatronovibrionaceae bacterium]
MNYSEKCPVFEPVQSGRAGEDIALQLQAAILEGSFPPGERLPSERELQSMFRTGRGVVREALQILKHKGLIRIHKGSKGGAYVKNIEVVSISESFAMFLVQNRTDPQHLMEFRETLDHIITELAIARGHEAQKQLLVLNAEKLSQAAAAPDPDLEHLAELDRELNILLARMTGNPIFEWIMSAVQLGFSSMDVTLYQDQQYRLMAVNNWKDTAREIAAGQLVRARSYISYHYMILRSRIKEIQPVEDKVFTDLIQREKYISAQKRTVDWTVQKT